MIAVIASPEPPAALQGVVAAAVGIGVGEAVAGATGTTSPVLAVGDVVVDVVPEPIKRLAIALFDTGDKLALQVGILLLLALAAVAIGHLARRRRGPAVALAGGIGLLGVGAAVAAPESGVGDVLPSLAAAVGAAGTLGVFTRPTRRPRPRASGATGRGWTRRRALRELGGGVAVAVAGLVVGRVARVTRSEAADAARTGTQLPAVSDPVDLPAAVGLDVDGLSPFETPLADFYRIDTRLDTPRLARDGWTLTVTGMVDEPMALSLDELEQQYEVVERAITLTCVSNEVGGDLLGTARWRGVRLADVLTDAGVDPDATQLVGRAFDDFTAGFPVAAAFDRDALLVVGMNGEPLPAEHGYPLRLVVPGLYGYVSATKWLTELDVTTFDAFDQYWVERGWSDRGPIRTQSRIDTPTGLSRVSGVVPVAGVAWAQTRGIERVEVRVDDGPWQDAELAPAFNDVTWRQWVMRWDTSRVAPGRHDLTVRATDATGEVQTGERRTPFPDGATGWHRLAVIVADA